MDSSAIALEFSILCFYVRVVFSMWFFCLFSCKRKEIWSGNTEEWGDGGAEDGVEADGVYLDGV